MRKYFLFLLLGLSFYASGQQRYNFTNDTLSSGMNYPPKEGLLHLYQEDRFYDLLERYKYVNVRRNGMDGFRIQIFFESGRLARGNAYQAKAKFLSSFQGISAYVDYQAPFFKVSPLRLYRMSVCILFAISMLNPAIRRQSCMPVALLSSRMSYRFSRSQFIHTRRDW